MSTSTTASPRSGSFALNYSWQKKGHTLPPPLPKGTTWDATTNTTIHPRRCLYALPLAKFQYTFLTFAKSAEKSFVQLQHYFLTSILASYLALSSVASSAFANKCPDRLVPSSFPLSARNEMEPSGCQTRSNRALELLHISHKKYYWNTLIFEFEIDYIYFTSCSRWPELRRRPAG